MTLDLHATPEEVMRAVEALLAFAHQSGVGERDLFGLSLALEECASNIVNHACQHDCQQTFRVTFERSPDAFAIELRDCGAAFDPTAAPVRKLEAEDEDLPGGWGIQLVRRYMDDVRYRREAGENVLRLIKRLEATTGGQ
jgi:anti-sigma regulatory factor (Ser/Thr protein kinase)